MVGNLLISSGTTVYQFDSFSWWRSRRIVASPWWFYWTVVDPRSANLHVWRDVDHPCFVWEIWVWLLTWIRHSLYQILRVTRWSKPRKNVNESPPSKTVWSVSLSLSLASFGSWTDSLGWNQRDSLLTVAPAPSLLKIKGCHLGSSRMSCSVAESRQVNTRNEQKKTRPTTIRARTKQKLLQWQEQQ